MIRFTRGYSLMIMRGEQEDRYHVTFLGRHLEMDV